MKLLAIASCVLVLFANVVARAQVADTLVAEGRAFMAAHNVTNANARFASALAIAPAHENANVLYAATRLLTLADKPAGKALLDRFGFAATNRNVFAWTATAPTDTNGVPFAPTNMSAAELSGFLRTNALLEINGALANLASVSNPSFTILLTANETGISKVTIDYGDLLLMRAGFHFAQYAIYTVNSWNLDVQLSTLRALLATNAPTAEEMMHQFPELFTFASTNDLAAARQAFSDGVALYVAASSFIRRRPLTDVRFFNYDPESSAGELLFRATLNELKQSLNGPVILTLYPRMTVNLGQHFSSTAAPRPFSPEVTGNAFVAGTLPDSTFAGLIDGVVPYQIESLLGAKKHLGLAFVPKLTVLPRLPDGRFQMTLAAIDGTLLGIQVSADLQTWVSVAIVSVTNGILTLVDNAAGESARYYRAVALSRATPTDFHPPHDDFAHRSLLTGTTITAISANFGATAEPGEPQHVGESDSGSVWWSWTAPSSGLFSLDTIGSSFDTLLAVYQGEILSSLSEIASDDDGAPNLASHVVFSATAGVTYQITVAGYPGGNGKVVLHLRQLPPNDNFEDRLEIAGMSSTIAGSNINATKEFGERKHAGVSGGSSVWWTWTAPSEGNVTLDTFGSSFDTLLAVYSGGDDLFDLFDVASNDDTGTELTSELAFVAQAGTTYQIAVDGYRGASGNIILHLQEVPVPPPVNDQFLNRSLISGTNVSLSGANFGATKEVGEPEHPEDAGGKSVWWTWSAPVSGVVTIDTFGSSFDTILGVYTGSSVSTLTIIASNDDNGPDSTSLVTFSAVAGITYQIAVDGFDGEAGNIILNLRQP